MSKIGITYLRTAIAFILLSVWLSIACASTDEIVLVVNPQIKNQYISQSTARTIFGMRLSNWKDNPIKVFVLPDDDPIHNIFSKQVLGMFPHQLRWAWDRQVFSGTGRAPIMVNTEEEMRQRIASTPGAIGYLRRSQVDGSVHELLLK
jgi:ABC-type phosphate transport system substrate-binding protein